MIEKMAAESDIHCIFGEPFHGEEVVKNLGEQMNLNVSFLDPMGVPDKSSPEGSYMTMMNDIAMSVKSCVEKRAKS